MLNTRLPKRKKNLQFGAHYYRKQRQGNTYWLAWSLLPRDRMNAWHRRHGGRGWGHQTMGTGSCEVSPVPTLSPVPELCTKNGQCLCARQNFNKGVRRWWGEGKKRRRRRRRLDGGAGVDRGSMPHNRWQDEEIPSLQRCKRTSCLTQA